MTSDSEKQLKPLTYRVQNIPTQTREQDLKNRFLASQDRDYVKVKSWSPSVDSPECEERSYTATIYFYPPTKRALQLHSDDVVVDKDFYGFTPLYTPSKDKGPIVADVIAITGLTGHAYGSWAHSPERMWLRDYLPQDAPNARILTYGYKSTLQGSKAPSKLADHTSKFINQLIAMRETAKCESRPIIFIGHSLGCLIIKQTLTSIPLMGLRTHRLPVRAIVFLAAPHGGLDITAIETLVKGQPTEALIQELKAGSHTLEYLRDNFRHVAQEIEILSCYENEPTKTIIEVNGRWERKGPEVIMVTAESARQFSANEKWEMVDADHSQIAKITRGEGGIYSSVLFSIRSALTLNAHILTQAEAHRIGPWQQRSLNSNDDELGFTKLGEKGQWELPRNRSSDVILHRGIDTSRPKQVGPLVGQGPSSPTIDSSLVGNETTLPSENLRDSSWNTSEGALRTSEVELTPTRSFTTLAASVDSTEHDGQEVAANANLKFAVPTETFYTPQVPSSFTPIEIVKTDSALVRAIKAGDYAAIELICKYHPLIDDRDDTGLSPLAHAAKFGLNNQVKTLLAHGASKEVRTFNGMTPFMLACAKNHIETARILLPGSDINSVASKDRFTALNLAVCKGHYKIVDMLLDEGADIEKPTLMLGIENTPLDIAVKHRQLEVAKLLLKRGAKVSGIHRNGNSPLFWAVKRNNFDMVKLLLDAHSDPNAPYRGYLPICEAASLGSIDIIDLLLQRGANIDKTGECLSWSGHWDNRPAVWLACYHGHIEVVRMLLKHKADLSKLRIGSSSALKRSIYAYTSFSKFYGDVDLAMRKAITGLIQEEKEQRKLASKAAKG